MGGRGSKSTGHSKHNRVITAKEFYKALTSTGKEHGKAVKLNISLKRKVKEGTATKNDKKMIKNYKDAQAMRFGYKNHADYVKGAEKRKDSRKKADEEYAKAKKGWRQVTSTTWERAQKNQQNKFASWFWGGRQ